MANYDELVDIRSVKLKEKSSSVDNALFFLEQIKNHTLFKVDHDVVEIRFAGANKTLATALASYIQEKNRA